MPSAIACLGEGQRHVVGGEGAGIVAEHVPRELVEHEDRGKHAFRGREPRLRHPVAKLGIDGTEARRDGGVDRLVASKPVLVGEFPEPEAENIVDRSS